jgi:uncharacterized protein YndB with AHSA1/START domain
MSTTTTFTTSRHLSASPTDVFAAIENPERLARWWGPNGFSNTFQVFEFKPQGNWAFDMVGPDGSVYPNTSVFKEIDADRRVVIQHVCSPLFELSLTLEASGTGTLVLWEQTFADAAVADAVRHIVVPANEENLDRWAIEVQRGGF